MDKIFSSPSKEDFILWDNPGENESYNYSNFLQNPLVILIQLAEQTAAQWWDC